MAEEKKKSFFQKAIAFFKSVYEWVEDTFGDPAISTAILDDLGLDSSGNPTVSLPADRKAAIEAYVEAEDPDKEAFMATVAAVTELVQSIMSFIEVVKEDGAAADEIYYRFVKLTAIENMRVRYPTFYTFSTILGFIYEEYGGIQDFHLERLTGLLSPDPLPVFEGGVPVEDFDDDPDQWVWFASDMLSLVPVLLEKLFDLPIESYYGWEPDPESTTPVADLVSQRALTVIIGDESAPARPALTLLLVPREHGGFGLVASVGGQLSLTGSTDNLKVTAETAQAGTLSLFMPTDPKGDPEPLEAATGFANNTMSLEIGPKENTGLVFGNAEETHFSIGEFTMGFGIGSDRVNASFALKDATLVVKLDDGDGFLASLPGGDIEFGFDLSITWDSETGVSFDGGTGLQTNIPVNESLFGVFRVQFVELAVGPSKKTGYHVALEVGGAFGLDIGPFSATVERLGFSFDVKFGSGNLGMADVDFGFKPPSGIGMAIDAAVVKGGGYLFFDESKGEYAGVFELKIGPVGLKAIGILTTKMPDGSEGWALILLIFAEFPAVQLGFGFALTGVGGVIGLQHGISIKAIQDGMRTGALDHVLFPDDPVANAPSLLNSVRAIYPITARALVIGPMAQIVWGSPAIVIVDIGIVIQIDNVLHATGSAEIARITLIGKLNAEMPPKETRGDAPALLKLTIDILGYFDFTEQALGIDARLRDSKIAMLTITGSFVLRAYFGDRPGFLMAAGGFHPNFEDVPPDVPKQDRVGVKLKYGPLSISIAGYFAITSNTVQLGAQIDLKVGPFAGFSIVGYLGFDALFQFDPFRFSIGFRAGVALKMGGSTLMEIKLEMTLEGPGRWHIFGKAKFKILFFSKTIDFDEEWGDRPTEAALTASASQALEAEAEKAANWTAALPAGGESLITLRDFDPGEKVMAHPLGSLAMRQKVVPLQMELDKLGEKRIDGATKVDITSLTVGAQSVTPEYSDEHFARAQYLDLSEEEKLKAKSFERLKAGVVVSTDAYKAPASWVTGDLSYETKYLRRDQPFLTGTIYAVEIAQIRSQARLAGTGRSKLRHAVGVDMAAVSVKAPEYMVAGTTDLASANGDGSTGYTEAVAAAKDGPGVQVVEAYELAGVAR